jgi:hypothetical protein
MDALTAIRRALADATSRHGWPIEPEIYDGQEAYYITYNYADINGADFSDDTPSCDVADVQIHFFMPSKTEDGRKLDYWDYKAEIRKALFTNGFTYPSVEIIYEKSEDRQKDCWHLIFECEYTEYADT